MALKIGITGGIGSGKSYVCRMLKERGIPVYDCDTRAKALMTESDTIRHAITALVGDDAYTVAADGQWQLNRSAVAAYLFDNQRHADRINAVVHPVVKDDFAQWAERQQSDIVAQECAILYESGFETTVDIVVAVCAPLHIRLHRAMQRDNATEQQIRSRMEMQLSDEDKQQRADYCINNDGKADLSQQIDNMLGEIKGELKRS